MAAILDLCKLDMIKWANAELVINVVLTPEDMDVEMAAILDLCKLGIVSLG